MRRTRVFNFIMPVLLLVLLYVSSSLKEGWVRIPTDNCELVFSSYAWLSPEQKKLSRTRGSHMNLMCTFLLSIFNSFTDDIQVRLVGWKSTRSFDGFISKVQAAHTLAKSLGPDTILFMTDAFDVLVQRQISCEEVKLLLNRKFQNKMVFVGEKQCYPLSRRKYAGGEACKDYSESSDGSLSRYLNGGSWVGFAKDVVTACEIFISNFHQWQEKDFKPSEYRRIVSRLPPISKAAGQDQYGFAIMYLYGASQVIDIDTMSEIFITNSGYLKDEVRISLNDDGLYVDRVTGRIPSIIHFNAGKDIFKDKVQSLPWMKAEKIPEPLLSQQIGIGPDIDDDDFYFLDYRDMCPADFLQSASKDVSIATRNGDEVYSHFDIKLLRLHFDIFKIFSSNYCGFIISDCVGFDDVLQTSALTPMPKLAYYNSSMFRQTVELYNISLVYSKLPSIPKFSLGSCMFVASGKISSLLGNFIDSHRNVIRISAVNLYEEIQSRGCRTNILLIKPHRRKFFDNDLRCLSELKYYWEPSRVFTYGNPKYRKSRKKSLPVRESSPHVKKGTPIIETKVDYSYNGKDSPPYPITDEASVFVEQLFSLISEHKKERVVPSSGFRFLVQLILSKRCTNISATGFSGHGGGVYFHSLEKMSSWHDPALELSILQEWSNEIPSFQVYV